MQSLLIKPIDKLDIEWIKLLLKEEWGSEQIVTRGKVLNATAIPGFKAVLNDKNIGLIKYFINKDECEIVTLNSLEEGKGIGTKLVQEVIKIAKKERCRRVWVITTNDNKNAINFYKKRDFSLKKVHVNAIEMSRKLKPGIPKIGINNIPIKDELELELKIN